MGQLVKKYVDLTKNNLKKEYFLSLPNFKLALLNNNLAFLHFSVDPDDDFDMDNVNVRTKVEESDDEMENLAPAPKRGRGRGSRGKQSIYKVCSSGDFILQLFCIY